MKEKIWLVLTTALLLKIILGLIQVFWSLWFYTRKQKDCGDSVQNTPVVFLLLPLLREQKILKDCFQRFESFLKQREWLRLVFVTTEREITENCGVTEGTTIEILQGLISNTSSDLRQRIIHLHHPGFNRVVAEQLNYAIRTLESVTPKTTPYYLLIYNADSVVTEEGLGVLFDVASSGAEAAQQSSLFLWNFGLLAQRNKFLLAAFALYQSVWTLQHEVPRLLASSGKYSWLPSWFRNASLVHAVSHGLLLRDDVVRNINGFPVNRFGGEDLGLGLILKVVGYDILPVPTLENTEIPSRGLILLKQLAGWYLGTLGYLVFWRRLPRKTLKKHWLKVLLITTAGIFDTAKWLLKGPAVILYLLLAYSTGHLGLSLLLYIGYVYTAVFGMIWLWHRLPSDTFPKPRSQGLIAVLCVYWLVPIVRTIPAVVGLWWGIRNALGFPFLKPKTER
ncbi:hypothetical protein BH20ACI2_BH20ACI2_02210 [soil metagenome]